MNREYMVMIIIIIGAVLSIFIFVRKKNIREAFLAAMVVESFTWPIGLLFVAWGKVVYPVRLFSKAIDNSFLQGFVLNPTIFAIYYIYYPKQAKLIWRWAFTLIIVSIPLCIEIMEIKYTNLIKYKDWR